MNKLLIPIPHPELDMNGPTKLDVRAGQLSLLAFARLRSGSSALGSSKSAKILPPLIVGMGSLALLTPAI
jgi:hypothetical protein